MTPEALVLLVGLLVAHFLGDFSPLSTPGMQRAKAEGGPMGPILGHAAVHGALVAAAVLLLSRASVTLVVVIAALEVATHFAIDAWRALAGARFATLRDPARAPFWRALGMDQLAHQLVLVGLTALAIRGGGG